MGVAGSGKTTIARLLAEALHSAFLEGDDLHSPANREKMRHGTPLTDADRLPWLRRIAAAIDTWRAQGQSGVVTCSALKRQYRDILMGDRQGVRLVYLEGSPNVIRERLASRQGHFMPPALLDSQFKDLEPPGADENPITADVRQDPAAIVSQVLGALGKQALER
jgi:carbohydrate kinase (thermoresistant glucokinase family)